MRFTIICFVLIVLCSCHSEKPTKQRNFSKVEINALHEDTLFNIRALELLKKDRGCIFLNSDGRGGLVMEELRANKPDTTVVYDYFHKINTNIILNYRSVATTNKDHYGLTIGSPAYLLRAAHESLDTVYKETHPKTFYDSMDFWNDQEGIAIGDPTDDCMSVIITRDGGETWAKLSCDDLPKAKEGEAAFAASDTNIAIVGYHTWVATGGKASRILYSPDKGKTWELYDTPIIQGKETTGMYSIDFYDENNGFAIGGDYTKPNDTLNNKIRTQDGGKTWQVVANGKGPGYRSCVQYVPNSNAKELVAIGFKGIDYSNDAGETWKHLSDEGFYTIRFLNDSVAYAAGKGRISKLTFRE
ncbi:WD40/YVTN/BNR-like repeat-containing protein [Winogradskyella ouciana]|uniref:Oxidoreductase n=1 Tax=Winogradskyella ouciana TaxID=2608631 RepID=A0A7K1GGC6_9FLAO|nr:oxidoreductase [Winogradskyella ouciana]MTE27468.1 oxidoreductase [Winogradskyella ouciana]